jgi:hypothetical protein
MFIFSKSASLALIPILYVLSSFTLCGVERDRDGQQMSGFPIALLVSPENLFRHHHLTIDQVFDLSCVPFAILVTLRLLNFNQF